MIYVLVRSYDSVWRYLKTTLFRALFCVCLFAALLVTRTSHRIRQDGGYQACDAYRWLSLRRGALRSQSTCRALCLRLQVRVHSLPLGAIVKAVRGYFRSRSGLLSKPPVHDDVFLNVSFGLFSCCFTLWSTLIRLMFLWINYDLYIKW